ncbi:DNA replication/repair protein RecF [Alicyclobacillus mali (ex Roth et al. 2021)]|uniref:DNA replication/repair protein RecF n=1 Tax=Alicyclobacillus mali (ex Roth et al. 2021) TaxID=1123961 RepID=UPI001A8C2D81|nr:DNA replication/repair protein RecF [Alicyclobacillus mali (ex Roth et al. 2021)]
MDIRRVELSNFRNYPTAEIELSPGVNVLVGENGQGKTNAMEAMLLIAVGKSHRAHRDRDLIRWEQDRAQIILEASTRYGDRRLKLELGPDGRRAFVNGVQVGRMTEFVGQVQVVLFAPEDLDLVKGGPRIRRRFLDTELGQMEPLYLHHLSLYNRAVLQRNRWLKSSSLAPDDDMLAAYDGQLALHGAHVIHRRLRFLERLRNYAARIYSDIASGRETFSLAYRSSVSGLAEGMTVEEMGAFIERALERSRAQDLRFGTTSVGPHRDDILLFLDGREVHAAASQGQQRTIALSLRLAEIDFMHEELGEYPVLLLDDVLSELDDVRQRNLVLGMSRKVQTVITTTSLNRLGQELDDFRLFRVCSGIIAEERV